jgi:two-component system, LuxR family, response regulator TtrR
MIHLVDDDLAVTNSCAFLLECMGYRVRSWNRSEDFLQNAPLYEQGIALLDMRMPGMDGHELFQAMREKNSTLAVIFLTGHGDIPMAVKEMQLGAVNFLQKPVAAEALKAAIFAGYEHTKTLNETYSLQRRFQRLTPKEKNVAQYIVAGMMNKDIALRMNIALRTVEVHRSKVMDKMEAKTMAELIYQLNKIPVSGSVP